MPSVNLLPPEYTPRHTPIGLVGYPSVLAPWMPEEGHEEPHAESHTDHLTLPDRDPSVPARDQYPREPNATKREAWLSHLEHALERKAADSRGSDPEDYLSDDDLKFVRMLQVAANRDHDGTSDEPGARGTDRPRWPGSEAIWHRQITRKTLSEQHLPPKPLLDDEGNPIKGYRIGYLNVRQFQSPVLFCSDGKLRMLIKVSGHGKKAKNYSGYATLPDAGEILTVRDLGTKDAVSINHSHNHTLRTEIKRYTSKAGEHRGIDIDIANYDELIQREEAPESYEHIT